MTAADPEIIYLMHSTLKDGEYFTTMGLVVDGSTVDKKVDMDLEGFLKTKDVLLDVSNQTYQYVEVGPDVKIVGKPSFLRRLLVDCISEMPAAGGLHIRDAGAGAAGDGLGEA